LIEIAETQDRQTCYALRHEVFVLEQGYTAEGEVDEMDAVSNNLLVHEDGRPIGTARIYLDGPVAKIGRVCVIAAHRGTGLGADLIKSAVSLAVERGATRVILGAQLHAIGFYAKLGFVPFDDIYDDEGEPHQMMEMTV
jgi:predicted GNAT family N-acyltransferase